MNWCARVCALACAGAVVSGCVGPADRPVPANWNPSDPFGAVSMRVYPLTHVERPASGQPRLVCHVEFTDRWYDTVKAAGTLEIQLFRSGDAAGTEQQRATWEVDLTDLERNAEWFDPVTRTYRIQLDMPGWADDGPGARFRLHAVFTTPGATMSTMRDDYVAGG